MESGDACNTRLALGLGFHELEPPSRRRKTQRVLLDQDDDRLLPSLSLGLSEAAGRWASRVDHTGMAATKDSNRETSSYYSNCSTSPKRSQREVEAAEFERRSMMISDDDEDCSTPRKKLRLSKEQISVLEDSFTSHTTLNPKQKEDLARQLSLRPRQVEVWFQNRRARIKLKQTEVDCETLKRRCETLREENRRLQEELQELKSQGSPPPFPMQVPASALPMVCPSCKRVGNKPESSTTGFLISGSTPKSRICDIRFTNPSAAC